jgi:hypothetical protein
VGSKPIQDMDVCVCVYSVFMFSYLQVAALRQAYHPSKESYHLCKYDYGAEEKDRAR